MTHKAPGAAAGARAQIGSGTGASLAAIVPAAPGVAVPPGIAPRRVVATVGTLCKNAFCHQIGVINLQGNTMADCSRGSACRWDHVDVAKMAKAQRVALATKHKAVFGSLFDTVIKYC